MYIVHINKTISMIQFGEFGTCVVCYTLQEESCVELTIRYFAVGKFASLNFFSKFVIDIDWSEFSRIKLS